MGLIGKIVGIVFLVIIVALIIFILYEYFVNKGANICAAANTNPFVSLIFSTSCKCPDSDGKDPNGTCYTCPTMNNIKTSRTVSAVDSRTTCGGAVLSPCAIYGSNSFLDGTSCYSCPSSSSVRTLSAITSNTACGTSLISGNASAILNGPTQVPAILAQSILF
jgi:hypothetical protein